MPTAAALEIARSIPRPARVRQGFSRVADMAAHIQRVRDERKARRAAAEKAERHGLGRQVWRPQRLAALQAVLDARPDLRRAARDAAGLPAYDSRPTRVVASVVWRGWRCLTPMQLGHPHRFRWRGQWKTARGSYVPSTRRVAVPAGWLALRLLREAQARREAA